MKKIILCAVLSGCIMCACSDKITLNQTYSFDLLTMSVPKEIAMGETVEIPCKIIKGGDYERTEFYIRYFQPEGNGRLRLDDGRILSPNSYYPLTGEKFNLYYTSQCTVQQTIDIYIEDNFGRTIVRTFVFADNTKYILLPR
jgi:hypothetical protein